MFTCLQQIWDWFDPNMENKKAHCDSSSSKLLSPNEPIHTYIHQHNPKHVHVTSCNVNVPSHQHAQISQPIPNPYVHQHNQQNSLLSHRTPLPIPSYKHAPAPLYPHKYPTGPNLYQSQVVHSHQLPQFVHQHHDDSIKNAYPATSSIKNLQQNSQIWMPHKPPEHYHPTLKSTTEAPKTPPVKKPHAFKEKDSSDKKKTTGSNSQQLRSPPAKRPPQAPVTIQGWLYKQGSDGLMLWKKRWFVLSEYCLFYYKGPEEEKILGNILLPSYKVSVCTADDKVNRKFAFKCEHVNMRTYILACDSYEQMLQWVQVLNKACNLETTKTVETKSRPVPAAVNVSQETFNYNEHFNHQFPHSHSSSADVDSQNQRDFSQYSQPLYANAPPKPKRLNDGYSSPSPDIIDPFPIEQHYNQYQKIQQPLYVSNMKLAKSPIYGNPQININNTYPHPQHYNKYLANRSEQVKDNNSQHYERRTPDTYGRSKLTQNIKNKISPDYEDVYAEQFMYKRPVSPIAYNSSIRVSQLNPPVRSPHATSFQNDSNMRNKFGESVTRPHSVDFLEYENKHPKTSFPSQQPRPKSSLDITRSTSNDNYFYSEERYAEKMRKFAQCLPKMYNYSPYEPKNPPPYPYERDRQFSPLPQPSAYHVPGGQPLRSQSVLSDESSTKELAMELGLDGKIDRDFGKYFHNEQFTRSASAKLLSSKSAIKSQLVNRDGDKKREESMKRLLEWKQRMLQSPFNRKGNPNPSRMLLAKSSELDSNCLPMNSERFSNVLPQYSSYSSDDEEKCEGFKKDIQTQAEWTKDLVLDSYTPARTTTVFNSPAHFDQNFAQNTARNKVEQFFEQPLQLTNKQEASTALVSNLRTELSAQSPNRTPENAQNPDETTQNGEENYMTMTPKKSIFQAQNHSFENVKKSLHLELEESSYVEMTQNSDLSLAKDAAEMQIYEMVCFADNKTEPVYVELNQEQLLLADKQEDIDFSDVLSPAQKDNKSDSSDADDEASKDLDSLYTPCHPRFSLSDTFRPASYYLNSDRSAPELQDSSDSELTSPPPIPTSSPPLDFENSDELPLKSLPEGKNDTSSLYSVNTDASSQRGESKSKRYPVSVDFYSDFHDYENLDVRSESRELSLQDSSLSTIKTDLNLSQIVITPVPFCFAEGGENGSKMSQAPYYYSDLSINTHSDSNSSILTLNNQRCSIIGNKKDITHIVNPIKCNSHIFKQKSSPAHQNDTFKLAAEARSASVDFLNIADKSGNIDKKNIYESDTLKQFKMLNPFKVEVKNIYTSSGSRKLEDNKNNVRRYHSLEGLLENVLQEGHDNEENDVTLNTTTIELVPEISEGSHLWEEDSVWYERLRSVSQRHTRSLDNLDNIGSPEKKNKKACAISRVVTYVNDHMFDMPIQGDQKANATSDLETKESSFIIDREKLRQWDFLSSAPTDVQVSMQNFTLPGNAVVDVNAGLAANDPSEHGHNFYPASGSISISNIRDTFPRLLPVKKNWPTARNTQSKSLTNLIRDQELDYVTNRQQQFYMPASGQLNDLSHDATPTNNFTRANFNLSDKINVSAGELLGRTHEELVLLLIQLRRQSANTCNAIETLYNEIDNIQAKLPKMDLAKRMENLQKLEQIKQHLIELEKQYEKGKPLVNLVDNMVKLGSLYRFPKERPNQPYVRDRLEFNQHIQERRLLAEEKRDWLRLSPNHVELQTKVQQLYQLDRLIQEESETLQILQRDKEEIERALGNLRHRLTKGLNNPAEIEQARQQQIILENELTRVHSTLAQNSKKLEETIAGNARLEQELLILKRKLQISRQNRSSPQISNAGDSIPCVVGTSAILESDLQRVQQKVGDLHRQRQELSMQVRQLTDRSSSQKSFPPQFHQTNKKKINSFWRETDLDTMIAFDHGEFWDSGQSSTPIYINTEINKQTSRQNDVNDDMLQNAHQEKQEIKTVRIVKRESERRQRDREKVVMGKWDVCVEEDDGDAQNVNCDFDLVTPQKSQVFSKPLTFPDQESSSLLDQAYCEGQASSDALKNKQEAGDLSPIFKSKAARQIITEMSQDVTTQPNRRAVPKEKRRHYTAPHNNLIKSLNQLPITDKDFNDLDFSVRRARDDLDMERALRQRIDTPDVVRSTLSNKELKYNENTIDNILGTPNKIIIPERYIPEQLPQLSAEEQQYRLRKVESIKKMLSDTAIISGSSTNITSEPTDPENQTPNAENKTSTKIIEEKKQREHLLQLNQLLAKQVMEISKIVAVKALESLPLESDRYSPDEDNLSPEIPLPIYQQRDNFYT